MGRRKSGNVQGVLLLDKPTGMTSNRALQSVRRHLGAGKAGHTGALDPLATGLLPLCFGEATKFSSSGLDADKTYQVRAQLGETRDTADADGEVVARASVPPLDAETISALLEREFTGEILQTPPRYSALKHAGKPLYQLAREGKPIPDKSRYVTLYDTRLEALGPDWLDLSVACSKGTYVRSLVEDVALALGTSGYVSALRRTHLGPFGLHQTQTLDQVLATPAADVIAHYLQPPDAFLAAYPQRQLNPAEFDHVAHGRAFSATAEDRPGPVRLYRDRLFCGLGQVDAGQVKCLRLVKSDLLD